MENGKNLYKAVLRFELISNKDPELDMLNIILEKK